MTTAELIRWLEVHIAYRREHWCCRADTFWINWACAWLDDIRAGRWK